MSEVASLPTREVEAYVTRKQLATLMGVSVSTIDRLVRQGMPSVIWSKRSRRFKPSVALAWARSQDYPD